MTLRLGMFAAVFAAFALPASALPVTPIIELNGGDGSVTVTEPEGLDMKIDIVGSDSALTPFEPGLDTLVSFVYAGISAFTLFGDWSYETVDAPAWDTFGYFVNDTSADLISYFDDPEQSGTFEFLVNPGTTFGFYISSFDNFGGRALASVEIAKGIIPTPAPIPLPASAVLMFPALGALAFLRRRAKART